MSQGRLPTGKKPHVIQNVAGEEAAQEESGSLPVYSEEEEETVLWKRMPKKNPLQGRTARTGTVHIRSPKDRNEQLNNKKKASRHYRRNRRRQVTEKSADKSETVSENLKISPRVEGEPSKSYSFRSRSKMVSYVSQQEEEVEKSWSEGSSVEDWLPEEEGSDAEEEEDPDEMEVEKDEEREEESEAGARRGQAGPQRKNPKKPVRSYPCPECSRKFNNSSNMRKHLRIHKGEHLYGCHACGKSYTDPSNLAHHQRKHTGERPYLCPTCPKAFSMKTNLDIHIRQHLGIRPFSCLQCGSAFYSRTRLVFHMKRHDRRPISVRCEDCDKTFSSQKQFYKHRRRHKDLVCEDCGEVFAFKNKYMFHRSLHKTCRQCGVRYIGMHLCNERVPSSASVPRGAVAGQTVDAAAHARGLKQPGPTGAERPSVSVNILLPTDVRLSKPARATCLKEISRVAQKSVSASQQTKSLASVSLPVLESRGAKPSTLSQKPLQLKPPGVLLQNVPSAQPVTSSPTAAKPFAQIPALLCPAGPATNLPQTQALAAFSISSAASPVIILLTDSHCKLLTVTAPPGPMQPSGSSPVTEAANHGKISMNPSTLPKIPSETIAPSKTAQICAICPTESVEKHQCTKLPQDRNPCHESVPRLSLQEPRNKLDEQLEEVEREIRAIVEFWEQCFVDGKKDTNLESPWISKWHLGHPLDLNDEGLWEDPLYDEGQVEQEALHEKSTDKSETVFSSHVEGQPSDVYNFRSRSKMVSYVPQQEEEAEKSWSEGSSGEDWLPEEEGSEEEEEDPDEMEVEKDKKTEREEESEAGARRWQAGPQRKNPKKTVRSYPCPEGSRKFNNSSNMRKHLRIHKGSSGEDWLPEEEGSDEEGEDPDEMEVEKDEKTERKEESEAGARRGQTEASVSLPVLESRGAEPSTLSQKPLQLKPPGVLPQNVPSAQPVTSSPTVAKSFAQIPALLWPAEPATNLPHTQALGASSISSAAPPTIYLLTDSNSRLLTVTAPLGPMQPSDSNPVTGAADNDLIPMNPASLPSDPKIPSGKSVPSISAQICATGQTESVEKHRCTKLPQDPTELCYPYTRHPEDPCRESIPPHSLKEHGNEFDKQLEEVEREIKAIMEFWEHSFVDGKEDASPESPWITCSTKETDLELQPNPIKVISDFVDKFIKEQAAVLHIGKTRIVVDSDPELISVYQPPPSTSKTPSVSVKVKQPELISVCQPPPSTSKTPSVSVKVKQPEPPPSTSKTPSVSVKVKQPEKRNKRAFDDTNNISLKGVFDSRGRLIPSAEALASLPQGGWTIRKKIYVNQRIAENH